MSQAVAHRYEQVARRVQGLVESGTLRTGDRVPSVRQLSRDWGVSINTVLEAYRLLEDEGRLEARPQSGYYVTERFPADSGQLEVTRPPARPSLVGVDALVLQVLQDTRDPRLVQLGAACPNPEFLPVGRLDRFLAAAARRLGAEGHVYLLSPGHAELRAQIARRSVAAGCSLTPEDLVITSGCLEALNLALRAVCKPGDTVAVESPCYFGVLQALQHQNLRALEIPTHPRTGLSLDALRFALEQQDVRAVLASPNFNNPLGCRMPDRHKEELVDLLADRDIPLIEDDIFGDLSYSGDRPSVCRAYDRKGLVVLCSSFSKDLAPGYRVGWIAPGRFRDRVMQVKSSSTIATATLPQVALADYLAAGGYDRHLRRVRRAYARQVATVARAVLTFFPEGTRVSRPQGGFVLWVEMPGRRDSLVLYERALEAGINLAPGPMFSARQGFRNFLRLNCTWWSERVERALALLGTLAADTPAFE